MNAKTLLSDKDKLKFNLQEKKTQVKLNTKSVIENKKKTMRKTLMINTQINPNIGNEENKPYKIMFNNVKSTVKSIIEDNKNLPYSLSPMQKRKMRTERNVLSPQKTYTNTKDYMSKTSLIKINTNKTLLQSNKVLKKVSMNLDESLLNKSTFKIQNLNQNQNQLYSRLRNKSHSLRKEENDVLHYKQSTVGNFSQLSINQSSSKSIVNINKNSHFSKNSLCFIGNKPLDNQVEMNIQSIRVINNEKQGKVNEHSQKKDNQMSISTTSIQSPIKKSTFVKFKNINSKEMSSKNESTNTDICFSKSIYDIKLNLTNINNTKLNTTLPSKDQDSSMNIKDAILNRKISLQTGGFKNEKSLSYRPNQNTNELSIGKTCNTNRIEISQNNNVWTHYIEKYIKYLFTGRALKFKDAYISKEGFLENGIVGYSFNIHKGLVRSYNEDRIVTLMNIPKPSHKQLLPEITWPFVSYYAIFDGHGGSSVCDWLAENLHSFIINQPLFPKDVKQAIYQGFKEAEENILVGLMNSSLKTKEKEKEKEKDSSVTSNINLKEGSNHKLKHDTSGSCALICMIIDKECFIINLGDSRALLSCNNMSNFYTLTNDHKPNDPIEKDRIERNGGRIWKQENSPYRVVPGGLSVSIKLYKIQYKIIDILTPTSNISSILVFKSIRRC